MITSVFLNLIYLFFPLCCYFIYLVYSKAIYEKEKSIFLDLALFSSFYFCGRFGELSPISSFLINLSLLIAIQEKRMFSAGLLSIGIAMFLSNTYETNVYLFLLQYLVIFILGFISKYKIINIFLITKVLFGILVSIFIPNNIINFDILGYAFIVWIIMYFIFYLVILFYGKLQMIVNMYNSLEEITKEKKLYESLFKITHEIKNPLAVCKGYLDMFDINNPAKANRYVGIINQEIDRTLLLLKDFSDVSKLNIEKKRNGN